MAEPMSEAMFDAVMARAGLDDLTPAEREGIRAATRHVADFAARVRAPAPPEPSLEPATHFAPPEPRA